MTTSNILQYESKIWATADLLRGCGIKESEWPSYMMPFFALVMIESRLVRMFDELKAEIGEEVLADISQDELIELIQDKGQGYNAYIFEKNQTLKDICHNDKSFDIDFEGYLHGFDGETKDLLGVDATEGDKFLDIKGVIAKLKAKKVLLGYTKEWSGIDLKPFDNSAITTLEEHIKRRWTIKRLKYFSLIVTGGSPRPAGDLRFYEGNIPFLKVGNLTCSESVYLSTYTHTIKEAGLSNTRLISKNTLLLTNSGATLGIPKICAFSTTFNDGIAAFTQLKEINQGFLFYFLKIQTKWYLNQASFGQGQPTLQNRLPGGKIPPKHQNQHSRTHQTPNQHHQNQ